MASEQAGIFKEPLWESNDDLCSFENLNFNLKSIYRGVRMVWVERDLKDHVIPSHHPLLPRAGTLPTRSGCSKPDPACKFL